MRTDEIYSNKKKKIFVVLPFVGAIVLFVIFHQYYQKDTVTMVMGGKFYKQASEVDNHIAVTEKEDVEKYFRPSNLPVLNKRITWRFFDNYFGKKVTEIMIPDSLLNTPEDTLLNYYSILREASNSQDGKRAGCGSIGNGITPYPVAYNFLSTEYQKKLSYKQYLKTFQNILHINLIKYREVPIYNNPHDIIRYFVEIETIEGSEKNTAYFAYYYGYVDITNNNEQYKISNLEFHGENYLCAPYHGWSHDAEASVQIRYGGWCSLIKEMYPTIQKGYIKNISFHGTDGNDYIIVFYQLTNDTDIEIAQYMKSGDGIWKLINLHPEKCLQKE